MRLKDGFSELDLNGVLLLSFPDNLSLAESRERLELMIVEAADGVFGDDGDDFTEPELSPFWIELAMCHSALSRFERMDDDERKVAAEKAWKWRCERFAMRRGENNRRTALASGI